MPKQGIKERILSHLKIARSPDTRQLLEDILCYMETPYDMAWLKDEYNLSQAEFDVLRLLTTGKTPAEISEITKKRAQTIRTQIHKAYRKCHVSNMAEFTALLLKRAANT
jgi:DNA-binding CsgD family transcriptional regulator